MGTASFFDYAGPGRISIARVPPAGFRVGHVLGPGPQFRSVDEVEYRRRCAAKLDALDPESTWDELHALAGDAEPELLCWKRKPDLAAGRAFCHRRIVAEWFAERLGERADER